MLTSVRSLMAASALAGALFTAAPAMAQDEESDITVTGSAAVVSDYRFGGVSLSNGDPAVQAAITVGHSSGFYVGTWGSSIYAGDQTITRTVTNVSRSRSTYTAHVSSPARFSVSVVPSKVRLSPGQSARVKIKLTRTSAAFDSYAFGSLVWKDGKHGVERYLQLTYGAK